jgi:phage-related protein
VVSKDPVLISWEGDSLEVLRSFPYDVRQDIGAALRKLQQGEVPPDIRPMKSIGAGVFEVKEQDQRAWYRVIYLSKVKDTIYVLHCFEKESAKTERVDLETARLRLVRVQRRLLEQKKNEKRKSKVKKSD